MAKGDEKLLRQLSLVSFLLSLRRPASAEEIGQTVEGYAEMSEEAFTRRFHADREDLERSGIMIEARREMDGSREVYALPPENFYLPDLELSPEEVKSLAGALNLLEGSFPYVRPLRLALAGLTHGHLEAARQEIADVPVSLHDDEEIRDKGNQLARLEDAVARRKRVRFHYYSAHRDTTDRREVEPYGIFRLGGHWYVVGRDTDRNAERMFRLSRMGDKVEFATKKPRDFSVPESYDPGRYLHRPPWLLDEPSETAVLAVDHEIAWWVERSYPQARRVSSGDHDEPWVRFEMPYASGGSLAAWVLELGRRAEILHPSDLRNLIAARLDSVITAHESEGTRA